MHNRRGRRAGTLGLAQNGETMNSACLGVVRIVTKPVAKLAEPGPILCGVQILQRQHMPHQTPVVQACNDRTCGVPLARLMKFENALIPARIGCGQDAVNRTDPGNKKCGRANQRGFQRAWLGLLCPG